MRMHFGEKLENSLIAEPGDFIFVPPHTIHVDENPSDTEPLELVDRNL